MIELEFVKTQFDDGTAIYHVNRNDQALGHITSVRGFVTFYPSPNQHGLNAVELINIAKKVDDIQHGW